MKEKGRTHLQCVDGLAIPVNKTASLTGVKGVSEASKSNHLTHVQR